MFFISDALAAAAPAAQPSIQDMLMQFAPLILIFVVFYLMILRPQMKRSKEHQGMLEALKKGDEVVTGGGIMGRVVNVTEQAVTVEIADNISIQVQKPAIQALLPKGTLKGGGQVSEKGEKVALEKKN